MLKNLTSQDAHYIVNVLEYVTLNSTAARKKVGAIIIGTGNVLVGQGFNSVARTDKNQSLEGGDGLTRISAVMHAEAIAIAKAARDGNELLGSTLYCTIPPCPVCCGLIIEAGIKRVVYKEDYWSKENLYLLTKAGIEVLKFD